MRRSLLILVLAHIIGSYAVDAFDLFRNYGMRVPALEILASPVRTVPLLIKVSLAGSWPLADLLSYWRAYFIPFSIVVGAGIWISRPRQASEAAGFPLDAAAESRPAAGANRRHASSEEKVQ